MTSSNHPKFPHYSGLVARTATYNGYWPKKLPILPAELIIHGFFYTRIADKVICYHCGGGIYNLESDDDIFMIHYKNYPNCEFLLRETSKTFRKERIKINANRIYKDLCFLPDEEDLLFVNKSNIAKIFKQKLKIFKATHISN